jgi:hypothetical protein
MNVQQLQRLLVDDVTLDDLVLAKGLLTVLDQGYQESGVETPEWVIDKLNVVAKEITNKNRVELQRKLRAAQARRATLATPEEKRNVLDSEIKVLQEKLG